MEDVFGGDGLAADAGFGEGHVLGDGRVEVVAHHPAYPCSSMVLDGKGASGWWNWAARCWQARQLDDVGVAAARAFGMKVDGAALEGGGGGFGKTRFVEGVSEWIATCIGPSAPSRQALMAAGRGAPVFMQFEADAGVDLLISGPAGWRCPLPKKPQVHGEGIRRPQHAGNVPRPRRAGGQQGCVAGPVPPPIMVTPLDGASSDPRGEWKWGASMPPAVLIIPSGDHLGGPMAMVTGWVSGSQ